MSTIRKAIIVEDDRMVASIHCQYLSLLQGIEVTAILHSGSEAWDYLQQHAVDLMILDVFVPDLGGMELLGRVRRAEMPLDVVMVTAANDRRSLETAMRLGALDYLVKPFSFERFRTAIQRFLERRRILETHETFRQSAIDRMVVGRECREKEPLSKGLQSKTLQKLRELMAREGARLLTCDEIAAASGLSRVTVRRYLNHMIDAGEAVSEVDYRTGGRPSIRYGWARRLGI